MTAYQLQATSEATNACGVIGGTPMIPIDSPWPRCPMCETEMVAFLDLLLPQGDAFQQGSRLQIFACRTHSEMAGTIYSDYTPFENAAQIATLPERYWEISDGHYCVRLIAPSVVTAPTRSETSLTRQSILATELTDDAADGLKLFGSPFWLQDPEEHHCSCGAPMSLLIQIPENYAFPMADGAEEQLDSFSSSDYCLFLGNQLYLFGCTRQCDPLALWPVLQN